MGAYMPQAKTTEWATPQPLFDELNAEFAFDLDACASADNAKCARYYTKEQDGLAQEWSGRVWCNPPYGRELSAWVEKAHREVARGGVLMCCASYPRAN